MKAKLNITIEENLLQSVKAYSDKYKISISSIVEDYFAKITKQGKRKNIIEIVKKLPASNIPGNRNLKEEYYHSK